MDNSTEGRVVVEEEGWGKGGGEGTEKKGKLTCCCRYAQCTGGQVQRTGTHYVPHRRRKQQGEFNHQPRSTGCESVGARRGAVRMKCENDTDAEFMAPFPE